jgi:hypothetical protein
LAHDQAQKRLFIRVSRIKSRLTPKTENKAMTNKGVFMTGMLEPQMARFWNALKLCLIVILVGCGQPPEPPPPAPEGPLGLQAVGVKATLPTGVNLDLSTLELQTGSGSSKLSSTGETQSQSLEGSVSLAFLRSANGKMLLAGWVSPNKTQISVRSTAEVLVYFQLGAYFSTSDVRQQLIAALSSSTALTPLEQAIATNLQLHPDGLDLNDPAISSALQQVRGVLSASLSKFANLLKPRGLSVKPDAPKSGILVKKADANQIVLENAYRRRAVAFIDKLSYVPSAGGSSVDAFEGDLTCPFQKACKASLRVRQMSCCTPRVSFSVTLMPACRTKP